MRADWLDRPATIEVTGVDGSEWVVCGPGVEPLVELDVGPSHQLYYAPVKTVWSEPAFGEGATLSGVRYLPRDIVLAFHIYGDHARGISWHETESAWARAWSYLAETKIAISTDSGTRTLKASLLEEPQLTTDKDPHLGMYAKIVMTIRARFPFWSQPPEMDVVQASGGTGEYKVTVSNPTDRPMWLRWVVEAGATFALPDFDFRGGTRMVKLPVEYHDRNVSIDTKPDHETITIAGWPNAWEAMRGVDFINPVPPGTEPTDVKVWWENESGGPHAAVYCDRFWSRPWGK